MARGAVEGRTQGSALPDAGGTQWERTPKGGPLGNTLLALVRGAGPVAVRAAFRKGRPAFGRFAGAAVYGCAVGSMSEKDDAGRLGDGCGAFTGRRRHLPALISTHRRIIITLPASAASARERIEPPLVITFIISVVPLDRQ